MPAVTELNLAITKIWEDKDEWLMKELIKGLEYVGIKIEIENNGLVPFSDEMKTILKIENKDSGKFYAVGLSQRIDIKGDEKNGA